MAATEQKIIYELLETIRNSEITDDEKITEELLRQYLYDYRNNAIKNMYEISEEIYQQYKLIFNPAGNEYVSNNLPDIIYDKSRFGISIHDFNITLPVVSKEEALNAQKSRFYIPPYVAYIQNGKISVIVNSDALNKLDESKKYLKNLLSATNAEIQISCILADPSLGIGYDWKTSNFPLFASALKDVRQNILRQEFGIMQEVKKDEVQNARADDIIYQDESKLYK